jgi:hypothetical protein
MASFYCVRDGDGDDVTQLAGEHRTFAAPPYAAMTFEPISCLFLCVTQPREDGEVPSLSIKKIVKILEISSNHKPKNRRPHGASFYTVYQGYVHGGPSIISRNFCIEFFTFYR